MSSPLIHLATGYGVYFFSGERKKEKHRFFNWKCFLLLAVSMFPDLDSIAGFVTGNLAKYHNNWSHSLFTGIFIAFIIAGIIYLVIKRGFFKWWLILSICYNLQVLIDFCTVGRGVMLFWPLTDQRFLSPVKLFYGLHWSQGLWSIQHIYTFINECFIIGLFVVIYILIKKKP